MTNQRDNKGRFVKGHKGLIPRHLRKPAPIPEGFEEIVSEVRFADGSVRRHIWVVQKSELEQTAKTAHRRISKCVLMFIHIRRRHRMAYLLKFRS